jgi:hypothetical protein
MPDPIDPAGIPGDNLRPDMVEIAASEMDTIGQDVSDQGGAVVTTWQRLAQHYEAPESGTPVRCHGSGQDQRRDLRQQC